MGRSMKGITRRGDSYRFVVSEGHDGNYKHIRKYLTFKPPCDVSEAQADQLAMEAYEEFHKKCMGNKAFNPSMRFRELAEYYFETYAPNNLKELTVYNYNAVLRNHLNPRFGNTKLVDIKTADITEFLINLPLASSSTRKIKIVLHSIMKYAVSIGVITVNPCVGAFCKKGEESGSPMHLTIEETKQLITLLDEYSVFNTIIKTLLHTGLRSGECLGLRWNNINFNRDTITVDKSLTYANNRWFLSSPKTKNSLRTINMGKELADILKKHKEEQDKAKAIVGEAWQLPDMVFTSCTGHWYDRSLLNTQFRRFMRKHNEFSYITIHGLRHTNASILIAMGEDIENVSKHLGHANATITSMVYSHMLEEAKVRITKTISEALY